MFNVRVEYESTPIRHIAVQCPECESWFHGNDITEDDLYYDYQIDFAKFTCPVCGKMFGNLRGLLYGLEDTAKIQEVSYPDVYKWCLRRKETWE